MGERGPGLIGGIAAGRPILSALLFAFAAMALAAVGYREADLSFVNASFAFIGALAMTVVAPAGLAAMAPKNFWLRAIYAGLAAGMLLALRRIVIQTGFSFGFFNAPLALVIAALAVFALSIGAPLWRAAVALSLIGCAALGLAAAAGLSIVAMETAQGGDASLAGISLALAAALGAALSVQVSAGFSRAFAEGGGNAAAAATAARAAAAPAMFSLGIGVVALGLAAFGEAGGAASLQSALRIGAGAIAFSLAAALFLLGGALAMKGETELTALVENRRRAALGPFLTFLRAILPPSSAIATSAIILIIAVVAGFEAETPASVGEIALISAVAAMAAVVFVSLRTALMATLMYAAASRIAAWGFDLSGLAAPTAAARVAASALAVVLYAQLFLAWRDRRNPRRKTREVVRMALADSLFAYAAASVLAIAALAASEAAGLWREGVDAALYAGALAFIGLIAGPPLMTAIGALFGRD